ncbi:MAG: response regulator, partial [bacterium]
MGQKQLDILHVEENKRDADLIRDTLVSQGIIANIVRVKTEDEFRTALKALSVDLILAGYLSPALDGLTALKIAREQRPQVPFIFVAGTVGEESVAEGLKSGATDYILKTGLHRLGPSIRRTFGQVAEHWERLKADHELREAQQAQLASEIRYRRLFESAMDGILILDGDSGKIVDVNPYLIERLRYSREEFLDKELWQ